VERCVLESSSSVEGPVAGSCGHGNEPLGTVTCGVFLD
jgi:hypothetical protein